jgi:TonB family protein
MKRSFSIFLSTVLLAALISSSIGQTVTEPVLLSKPDLVKPELPNTYLPGGDLTVWVNVDSGGNVSSVDRIDGPGGACPSLPGLSEIHKAAREAAFRAKFVAASRDGVPFDSDARIVFEEYVGSGNRYTVIRSTPTGQQQENPPEAAQNSPATKSTGDRNYQVGPPPDFSGPVSTSATGSNTRFAATRTVSERPLSGGVLNGKAKTLVTPPYPAAAKAVRASGSVTVQVLIDESGRVVIAEPIAGHPLLRSAARVAACASEFSPTRLEDRPVKVSGVITYNFTL